MNLLSLMRHDYTYKIELNEHGVGYITMYKGKIDAPKESLVTKIELENLRDNAKRLYEACNNALPEDERI